MMPDIASVLWIAALVGMTCLLTYAWYRLARRMPSAMTSESVPHGVTGFVILFAAGEVALGIRLFLTLVMMTMTLSRLPGSGFRFLVEAGVVLLPSALSFALTLFLLYALAVKRTQFWLAAIIVSLWVKGPVVLITAAWYFSMPADTVQLFEVFGWALCWTAYGVYSKPMGLLFGTERARRLQAASKEMK